MKSERAVLRMVCRILRINEVMDLKPMQIEVRFVRNRTNNLLNKAQAAVNLQQTQLFAPEDIITMIGVTETPGEMSYRGQTYWKNKAAATPQTNSVGENVVSKWNGEISSGGNGYGGKMA